MTGMRWLCAAQQHVRVDEPDKGNAAKRAGGAFLQHRRAVDRKILAVENRRLQPGLSKQTLAGATARPLACQCTKSLRDRPLR